LGSTYKKGEIRKEEIFLNKMMENLDPPSPMRPYEAPVKMKLSKLNERKLEEIEEGGGFSGRIKESI